jgi:hypothetical protein
MYWNMQKTAHWTALAHYNRIAFLCKKSWIWRMSYETVLPVGSGAYNVLRKQFMHIHNIIFQWKQISAIRKLPKELHRHTKTLNLVQYYALTVLLSTHKLCMLFGKGGHCSADSSAPSSTDFHCFHFLPPFVTNTKPERRYAYKFHISR